MSDPRSEARVAAVLEDYLAGAKAGSAPDRDALLAAHPDLAEALNEALLGLAFVEDAGGDLALANAGPPRLLGDFRIVAEVGRGGMGVVYEAEQISLRRRVALKVLPFAGVLDTKQLQRFRNEAQAAAHLHHTNIVPVYSVGSERGVHYYAMQFIEGESLAGAIQDLRGGGDPVPSEAQGRGTGEGPRSPISSHGSNRTPGFLRMAARIGMQAAEALDHAHQYGIVHRDVKPGNLLVDVAGNLWVTDFGLARFGGDAALTVTGDLVGTFRYMSPEQALAKRVPIDHRTDVYSLGATLYELVTLKPAVTGEDPQAVLQEIAFKDPLLPRRINPAIPAQLETILLKAMWKDPAGRYATAQEMADDLRRFLDDKPITARRPSPVQRARMWARRHRGLVAAAAAVLLLGTAALAVSAVHVGRARREREARAQEEARRIDAEYAQLCASAHEALAREHLAGDEHSIGPRASEVLDAAVRLAPSRPEAWLARALVAGRTFEERLADVDAAAARGLPERCVRLARASLLYDADRVEEAAREEDRAPDSDPEGASALFFEGLLSVRRGDRARAIECLTQVVQALGAQTATRYLALWWRGQQFEMQGDLEAALADLYAAEGLAGAKASISLRVASLWRRLGREAKAEALFAHLLERVADPGSVEAWEALLRECLFCREYSWMERAAGPALERHPSSGSLHSYRGAALEELGRLEEALAACDRALELDPRCAGAHIIRDNALYSLGRFEEQLAACDKALVLDPRDALAHNNRGNALHSLGRFEEALAACDKALKLDPRDARAHYSRGNTLRSLGRLEEALAACDRAIELDPRNAIAHDSRGNALQSLGRFEEALAAHDRAIELDPRDAKAHGNRGKALHSLGLLEEALAACDRAIELDPRYARAHSNRGSALLSLHRLEEALAACDRAIELDPREARAHSLRGSALLSLHRLKEGLAACDSALELDPRNATAHRNRGGALNSLGRFEEALAACDSALKLDPLSATAHCNRGSTLLALGRFEEALAACDKALKLDPRDARAHNSVAWLLATSADPEFRNPALAVQHAKRAVELTPSEGASWNTLGVAQYRAGDWKAAIAALERSMELRQGGDAFDWFFFAMARWQLGERDQARQWHDKGAAWMKKNAPDNAELEGFRSEAATVLGIGPRSGE